LSTRSEKKPKILVLGGKEGGGLQEEKGRNPDLIPQEERGNEIINREMFLEREVGIVSKGTRRGGTFIYCVRALHSESYDARNLK